MIRSLVYQKKTIKTGKLAIILLNFLNFDTFTTANKSELVLDSLLVQNTDISNELIDTLDSDNKKVFVKIVSLKNETREKIENMKEKDFLFSRLTQIELNNSNFLFKNKLVTSCLHNGKYLYYYNSIMYFIKIFYF